MVVASDPTHNVFADIPTSIPTELFNTLLRHQAIRIERIVSLGHASPDDFWYDQAQGEWVVLIKGSAVLEFEDGVVSLLPGDYVNIPAHQKHRVKWTTPDEPTIWLAVFYEMNLVTHT